jgi:ABC-2 type transport system permease protein
MPSKEGKALRNALYITRMDFLTLKSMSYTLFIYLLLPLVFYFIGGTPMVFITASWTTIMASSYTIFSLEEKNQLARLYATLPAKPETIVLGRYLFLAASYLAGILFLLLATSFLSSISGNAPALSGVQTSLSISVLLYGLIVSVQTPFYYKLGYTRARIVSLLPFLVLFLPMVFFSETLDQIFKGIADLSASPFFAALASISPTTQLVLSLLATAIMFIVSYLISARIYRRTYRL